MSLNSTVCAAQKETEFHTAVLDRRGAFAVLCIVRDIIEMELKMFCVCGNVDCTGVDQD